MRKLAKISSLLMALLMGVGIVASIKSNAEEVKAANKSVNVTYGYSDLKTMTTNYTDKSDYVLVPGGTGSSVLSISLANEPNSVVKITLNIATFGSGVNPTDSNFTLSSDCTNWTISSKEGTLPTSSTYTNYSLNLTKGTTYSNVIKLNITKPGKQIRLKTVGVSYTYLSTDTIKVAYDANGLTGITVPVDSNEYSEDDNVTVATGAPTGFDSTNYEWLGWSLTRTGEVVSSFKIKEATTLYARYKYIGKGSSVEKAYTTDEMVSVIDSGTIPTDQRYVKGEVLTSTYYSSYSSWNIFLKASNGKIVEFYGSVLDSSITDDYTAENAFAGRTICAVGTMKKYTPSEGDSIYELDKGNIIKSISAPKSMTSLVLNGQTTTYLLNQEFSFDGTAKIIYEDASEKEVTPTVKVAPDMTTAGTQTVTMSYSESGNEITAQYQITVLEISFTLSKTEISVLTGSDSQEVSVTSASGFVGTVTYTWSTTNDKVATVVASGENNSIGTISFLNAGKGSIVVTGTDGTYSSTQKIAITVTKNTKHAAGQYALCTSTNDLVAGDNYVIAGLANASSVVKAMGSLAEIGNNVPAVSHTLTNSKITVAEQDNNVLVLMLEKNGDNWNFFTVNYSLTNAYLTATNTTSKNYLKTTSQVDAYCNFSISFNASNEAIITCTGKTDKNIMRQNGDIISCYGSGQNAIQIYKQLPASKASEYANTFLSAELCDGGSTAPSTKTWGELKTAYDLLSADDKNIFKTGTASESGTNIEKCLARYDYIVGKYGKDTYADFMGRNPESLKAPAGANVFFGGTIDSSSTAIISIIATVSLLAFATIVVRKKRKEN